MIISHNTPAYEGYENQLKRAKRLLGTKYVFHKSNRIKKGDYEKARQQAWNTNQSEIKVPFQVRQVIKA